MVARKAEAIWEGDLKGGRGVLKLGSGAFEGRYSFASRFEEGTGTNPEELIGAALAGCFSMALSAALAKDGHLPQRVHTQARVMLENAEGGFKITRIMLETEGTVPGIDAETFQKYAMASKEGCIVSRALAAVEIDLNTRLVS